MAVGPLEIVVLGFDGNNFDGAIADAIAEAVDTGAIRVVDLVFAQKDEEGTVTTLELEDLDPAFVQFFGGFAELSDLISEQDAMTLGAMLPPDSSALLALIEHTWSTRIAEAVKSAGGQLLASQRISTLLMDDMREEIEQIMSERESAREAA